MGGASHARSGSVALPRVKVVLARAALLVAETADDRRAPRRALCRRSEVVILVSDREEEKVEVATRELFVIT